MKGKIKNESGMKSKWFSWFTWHLFPQPKDVPIKSVYEIGFFLLIFSICVYLYIECNSVPYCEENIRIECLDNKCLQQNCSNHFMPKARISYRIPYSSVDKLKNNEKLLIGSPNTENYFFIQFMGQSDPYYFDYMVENDPNLKNDIKIAPKDSSIMSYYKINEYLSQLPDSCFTDSVFQDIKSKYPLNKGNMMSNSSYRKFINYYKAKELDSLLFLYQTLHRDMHFPDSTLLAVYYYESDQTIRKQLEYKIMSLFEKENMKWLKNNDLFHMGDNTYAHYNIYQLYVDQAKLKQRGFVAGLKEPGIAINDPNNYAIGDPGWFTLNDISQAYFKFNINTSSIDSISLFIDFVGATEFSLMDPIPDRTTISGISFFEPEKIEKIKTRGLLFHAKFVELENRQNIRMFFLTAVMSGLFTIFIGFVVLGFYKILTQKRTKNKNNKIKDIFQNANGQPQLSETNCDDITLL